MVIYIESVFAFNVLVDYLLLFGAARVAGRTVTRRRLLLGAAQCSSFCRKASFCCCLRSL
jgi:hypothetical protein